jgi:hypothetical protein
MRDRRELRSSVEKILAQKILAQKSSPKIQPKNPVQARRAFRSSDIAEAAGASTVPGRQHRFAFFSSIHIAQGRRPLTPSRIFT